MSQRARRTEELRQGVERALARLDLPADEPAFDGWLDPGGLVHALQRLQAGEGPDRLLLRVDRPLDDAAEGFAPAPRDACWLRLSPAVARWVPVRLPAGDDAPDGAEPRSVRAVAIAAAGSTACCESDKCGVRRHFGELRITLDGDDVDLVVAGAVGSDASTARERLLPLAAALAAVTGAPLGEPGGAPVETEAVAAPRATPLPAHEVARWGLRREGELLVVRDYASRGPRESAPRLYTLAGLAAAGTLGTGAGAALGLAAAAYPRAAIFGVVAIVLAVATFALAHIAVHAARYRERTAALLYLARNLLVLSPWVSRDGAVEDVAVGRYGAGLELRELVRIEAFARGGGTALVAHTEHGPYELGVLPSEACARLWQAALLGLRDDLLHEPVRRARQAATPVAAPRGSSTSLALLSLAVACGPTPSGPTAPRPLPSVASVTSARLPPGNPSSTVPVPTSIAALPEPAPAPAFPTVPAFPLVEDDMPEALRRARAENKALFVEAWAPWCHTCLSMKHYVLPDPSLTPLADRVVFATVDTDKPENADFVARHPIGVWPTLFVLDAASGALLGHWEGSASAAELRTLITDAVDARDASVAPGGPLAAMLSAKRAQARGDFATSGLWFQRALDRGGPEWPRRSEALSGLLLSTYRRGAYAKCAEVGRDHAASIEGAAVPADFCYIVLRCAAELGATPLAASARGAATERLRRHVQAFPEAASVDDRSDALSIYAGALASAGDAAGARAAKLRRLELLEAAAAAAPDARLAATFDYGRLGAYLSLGRGDEAVAMLTAREQQLPDDYEPPARLAEALMALGRRSEALAPLDRAIARSYGPRQLRYLTSKADTLAALGRTAEHVAALEALVAAHEALPPALRNQPAQQRSLQQARAKLAAARRL